MKKIIFTTVAMGGGGTERVISILANLYVEQGLDVSIYMIAGNQVEYELDSRVHIQSIATATGGSFIGRLKRIYSLRKCISEEKDAWVIAMGTVTAMFTLAALIGKKTKVVISERNDPNRLNHKPITKTVKILRNILYSRAKNIVLQTEDVKQCFPDFLQKKLLIISNPISSDLPEVNESAEREKTIITAGRLTEQKNHKLLLSAFREFVKEHPEYRLKIFGRGEMEEELQNLIQDWRLEEKVILEGFTNHLQDELKKGSIYVSSSNWEGISNSLMEAMAMGMAVIATDCPVGGSRILIQSRKNGILIPVEDEKTLLEAMQVLAEHPEFRKQIAKQAMQIRVELSKEKVGEQWLECFQ